MFELLAEGNRLTPRKLYKRIGDLRELIQLSADAADSYLLARASANLDRVEERIQLGADFTVAALVGGTGSGKSTLFNSLTGFDFADAGALRPTTERATACTWRAKADGLLDHLDIDQGRRIEHDSVLSPVPDELEGLILLDLPDYDSVKFTNSLTVSRLMPMLDVLIWVVDPQKYADQLLHRDYLANLRARARQMVVVMNHIDTVLEQQVPVLMQDLRRLLDADGLEQVPAYPISALQKTGLLPLHEMLREAVCTPSTNLVTAASQVDQTAWILADTLAGDALDLQQLQLAVEDLTEQILRSSGVPTVLEQLSHAGDKCAAAALVAPVQPAPTLCNAIRDTWVERVSADLPSKWAVLVREKIASADRIRRQIGAAYTAVPLPKISRVGLWTAAALSIIIVLIGIAGAIFAFPWEATLGRGLLAVGTLVATAGFYSWGKMFTRRQARKAARDYELQLQREISQIVRTEMIDGPQQVLNRYATAVELLN